MKTRLTRFRLSPAVLAFVVGMAAANAGESPDPNNFPKVILPGVPVEEFLSSPETARDEPVAAANISGAGAPLIPSTTDIPLEPSSAPPTEPSESPESIEPSESAELVEKPVEPPPLAMVDGVALTVDEIKNAALLRYGSEILQERIDFLLIRAALEDLDIDVADDEIDAALERRFRLHGDETATLAAAGLDRAAYRERVVWLELALRRLVMARHPPTDKALSAYLEANTALFAEPERARVFHILASPTSSAATETEKARTAGPEEWEKARFQAESWIRELRDGAAFGALALASDDLQTAAQEGEIGWVARGRLLREVEDAAFSLAPGEFWGPVRSPVGYHVIFVEDRRESWRPGLFEIRERVEAEYEREMFLLYARETLEGLREDAKRDGRLSFPALAAGD